MKLEQVLPALRQGRIIYMSRYPFVEDSYSGIMIPSQYLFILSGKINIYILSDRLPEPQVHTITTVDLFANDWEVFET